MIGNRTNSIESKDMKTVAGTAADSLGNLVKDELQMLEDINYDTPCVFSEREIFDVKSDSEYDQIKRWSEDDDRIKQKKKEITKKRQEIMEELVFRDIVPDDYDILMTLDELTESPNSMVK